ncbi:MAG: hypothetical protein ACRDYA_08955 [Egibacteraceae bacterium]
MINVPEFSFTLVITGIDELSYEVVDALLAAGCDDASFGQRHGTCFGEFDREASDALTALESAARQIQSVYGLSVHHVEPSEYVSLGQIAQRVGRTRENIRQLAAGLRGPGGFPVPRGGVLDRTRLWRWSEVVEWWDKAFPGDLDPSVKEMAYAVERFNLDRLLRARDNKPSVSIT